MGKVVVDNWGHNGAFTLAGSISLFAAFIALFLTPPGRPKAKSLTANPMPISRDTD
jgi:hypothetical protein